MRRRSGRRYVDQVAYLNKFKLPTSEHVVSDIAFLKVRYHEALQTIDTIEHFLLDACSTATAKHVELSILLHLVHVCTLKVLFFEGLMTLC